MDSAILHVPAGRRLVHAIASPTLERLTVEQGDVAVLVNGEILDIYQCLVHDFKVEGSSGRLVWVAFAAGAVAVAITFFIVITARYQEHDTNSCKE